jgi:hypothetical protein
MRNGLGTAVLVTDLLGGDGPHRVAADDFLAHRCSACGGRHLDDMRFGGPGFLCPRCLAVHGSC